MNRIQDAVREADVTVVLGFAEHAGGWLYIAQVTITPDGKIANHRRKLKVWRSDAIQREALFLKYSHRPLITKRPFLVTETVSICISRRVAHHPSFLDQSIHNVVQTPYGRLASLNCWEHIQVCLFVCCISPSN